MANARETALRTLLACRRQGAWSDGYLKKAIREDGLDRRDAALATRLCFGVLQNQLRLDWYLAQFSRIPLNKLEEAVLCILRLALYQLQAMDRVPDSAAVNEAVKLARKYSRNPRSAGLVNAVLRAYLRQRNELAEPEGASWEETMSLRYSHPQWLVEAFADRLGREGTEDLLAADNQQPPTTVQVNTLREPPKQVLDSLEAQGVKGGLHPWLPGCLVLTGTGDLELLDAYQKGLFYVQDAGARLAVLAAGPKAGQRVLDCCAAPGGKSFACAIQMEDQGEIVCCDIHPHKIKLLEAGRDRLGCSSLKPTLQNAAQPRPEWQESFDVVLADVPCSGLGIIRKKPDIRYKAAAPLAGLPRIQSEILANSAAYVRPGGTLLYSTCTILQRENEDVVDCFRSEHPEFSLENFTLPGVGACGGMLTLWPHIHGTDGFFMAKLVKRR